MSERRRALRGAAALAFVSLAVVAGVALARPASAEEGWEIVRFHADIAIESDGSLHIEEAIDVDFGQLERRGIFRDIPVRYRWSETQDRVYRLQVLGVRDASGRAWRHTVEREDPVMRIRIGDPDRTISGAQSYRIAYRVAGALNAFDQHDELFWNVNGDEWDVPSRRVSATVRGPAPFTRTTCFQGRASAQPCATTATPDAAATFQATRPFAAGEELTIVVALPKGAVAGPTVILDDRPRSIDRYFELTPLALGLAGAVLVTGLTLVGRGWWRHGRDRRFLARTASPEESPEITAPLFDGATIVPEYEPPEGLRPAQLGLVLDERADTLDLTATIVDLAVRGYLRIEHVPKEGLFGSADWRLVRQPAGPELHPIQGYERKIYEGIFSGSDEVLLSERKGKVAPALRQAQRKLYADAVERRWFTGDPERVRQAWAALGCVVAVGGLLLAYALGSQLGLGLAGVAVAVTGLVLLLAHRAMPRRTGKGTELLRRTLGFRRYMLTAEKDRAAFAEREGIFSEYLPYAIVFGCVDRWARAFEGIDREAAAAATGGWYVGQGSFSPTAFSSELSTFSSTVSGTIAYTPGSSGSSGFSGGGSSGGGGGGGGGGSW